MGIKLLGKLCLLLGIAVLGSNTAFAQKPGANTIKVTTILQGEIGTAEQRAIKRLFLPPFTTVGWLRADLTNEVATPDDHNGKSVMKRPFKEFSGDISGRYLELMALLSHGDLNYHPALKQMETQIPTLQKADGTFGWGVIDWNGPVDFNDRGRTPLMMPALWGNGRMLGGLITAYKAFNDPALLSSAKKLGDFYVRTANRFMDTARIAEYKKGGTYASGFVTCYFNGFEGLVKLYSLTKQNEYLQVSKRMANFLQPFDELPLDHTHGMLCNHVALLLLFDQTGDKTYLQRVENRWEQMVNQGYSDPTGGVLESTKIGYNRDEGCAETDWLRVNLELYKLTAKARYLDMAERLLQNHYLANQNSSGGFGHRFIINDKTGVIGLNRYSEEATWCCDFHGTQGFELLKPFVCMVTGNTVQVNYAMDFVTNVAAPAGKYSISSVCMSFSVSDSVLQQKIEIAGAKGKYLSLRLPSWSAGLVVKNANGKTIAIIRSGDFYRTLKPVLGSVMVNYSAPVRIEDRVGKPMLLSNIDPPFTNIVLRHGPKLLMADGFKSVPVIALSLNRSGSVNTSQSIIAQSKNGATPVATPVSLSPRKMGVDSLVSVFVFDGKLK